MNRIEQAGTNYQKKYMNGAVMYEYKVFPTKLQRRLAKEPAPVSVV